MRLNLGSKLFLAIFTPSVAGVLAMGAVASFNLSNGFVGYLNQQALTRTQALEKPLITAYTQHGDSWDFLRHNPPAWFKILRESSFDLAHPVPPPADLLGANLRISVYDALRRPIMRPPRGVSGRKLHWITLKRRGQRIGWLSLAPIQQATSEADVRFETRQSRAIWIIAGLALVLSALLAYVLARTLLGPVRRIAAATHQLAAGYYDIRVDVDRHDEIGQLGQDFNHLAQTLSRNETMRRGMMADISHELRTPLSVLRGELEALEDGVRPITQNALHSLGSEVGFLSKMVDDLYDLSLSDAGALAYRKVEVDLVDVLSGLRESYAVRLDAAGLHATWGLPDEPAWLLADEARLTQLFHNLLENSLRYTDAGGELRVRLVAEADILRVRLEDSAPPVAEAERVHLFERFYRTKTSRARRAGGAGLGLAICRNIVRAHDGSIRAGASALGGLCVHIALPRNLDRGPHA